MSVEISNEDKMLILAKNHAFDYLRFNLGGRRGCRVIEDVDKETEIEIIADCAHAMLKFANAAILLNKTK